MQKGISEVIISVSEGNNGGHFTLQSFTFVCQYFNKKK